MFRGREAQDVEFADQVLGRGERRFALPHSDQQGLRVAGDHGLTQGLVGVGQPDRDRVGVLRHDLTARLDYAHLAAPFWIPMKVSRRSRTIATTRSSRLTNGSVPIFAC